MKSLVVSVRLSDGKRYTSSHDKWHSKLERLSSLDRLEIPYSAFSIRQVVIHRHSTSDVDPRGVKLEPEIDRTAERREDARRTASVCGERSARDAERAGRGHHTLCKHGFLI